MRLQLHHAYLDGTTDLQAACELDPERDLDANLDELRCWIHRQMKLNPPPGDGCWLLCTEDTRNVLTLRPHEGAMR